MGSSGRPRSGAGRSCPRHRRRRALPRHLGARSREKATEPKPDNKPPRPLDSPIPWSELLLRVFREDVLACPCGGRRKVIAFINERLVIEKILGHIGLPTTGPPTA